MNIPSLLDKGERVAIFTGGESYTYQKLAHLVRQKALSLPHKPGEAVPFVAEKISKPSSFSSLCSKKNASPAPSPHASRQMRAPPQSLASKPRCQLSPPQLFSPQAPPAPRRSPSTPSKITSSAPSEPSLTSTSPPATGGASPFPLHHVGAIGILFRCLLAGAAIDLTEGPATHLSLVPTQLRRLLESPPKSPLKLLLLGGAPLPDPLLKKAQEQGLPIATSYGLTETSSLVTLCKNPNVGNEIGEVLPHRNLSLENGEIVVSGKTLFLGYLGEEKKEILKTGTSRSMKMENSSFKEEKMT